MRFSAALSAALAGLLLAATASAQSAERPDDDGSGAEAGAPTSPTSSSPGAAAPGAAAPGAATPPGALSSDQALVVVPAEPDQPLLEPIASARDRLGGHFVSGVSVGPKWPFGSLESGVKQRSELTAGVALNLDLGFGISRSVVLGLWGEYDKYSKPSGCRVCDASSFAGGPFVRYHLVQGTRFDPWGAVAIGVRHTSPTPPLGGPSHGYTGPEWLKLSLGGDWYPTANVGFGPYFSFGVGSYGSSLHTDLGTGLRVVLDFPGK